VINRGEMNERGGCGVMVTKVIFSAISGLRLGRGSGGEGTFLRMERLFSARRLGCALRCISSVTGNTGKLLEVMKAGDETGKVSFTRLALRMCPIQ
jgi:hypothetical protein